MPPSSRIPLLLQVLPWLGLCIWCDVAMAVFNHIPFNRLGVRDGLSQAAVHAIAQDEIGFMWFGTQEGLNRWDGRSFMTLRQDPFDPDSLSHSWIYALLLDRDGALWVGTHGGGVNRIDPVTLAIRRLPAGPASAKGLSSGRVRALYQDRSGTLWVGTDGGGLNRFDPIRNRMKHLPYEDEGPHSLGHAAVRCIDGDPEGRIWIGTDGGGLAQLWPDEEHFRHYRNDPADPESLASDRVSALLVEPTGRLWVGTYEGDLQVLDADRERFQRVDYRDTEVTSARPGMIRSIFRDRFGVLWIGTDEGLYHRSPASDRFTRHANDPADPHSLSENRVTSLFQDRGGVLWVGTYGGLSRWNAVTGTIDLYRHDPDDAGGLGASVVTAFATAPGRVWIGTYGGGLGAMDPESGRFLHHRHDPEDPASLGDDRVGSLLVDDEDTLWVGTMTAGLDRLRPDGSGFEHFRHDPDDPTSISADGITALHQGRDGSIWAATWKGGLNRLDPVTGRFQHWRHDPERTDSLGSDRLLSLCGEGDNMLWIGTHGSGLNALNLHTGSVQRIRNLPAIPTSLSSDSVYSLHLDAVGDLWIGTDSGLNRWSATDRRTGKVRFQRFTRRDGLPSDVIQGIESDDTGLIWLSTNRGLARLNADLGAIKTYDLTDGLQGYDFNQGAHLRASDGRLFFGGAKGFNVFDPQEMRDNAQAPPVVLTAFLKHNRPVSTDVALPALTEIELDHGDDMVSFEVAALEFTQPERNQLRYRLLGFDQDWLDASSMLRLTYTNLPPGSYKLRVIAANSDGVWNEQGLTLALRVRPAPWQTWWAYTLYGLGVVIALFVYLRLHARRLARTIGMRRQEEANEAKSRFLTTLSHEIRTPMSGVLGMTQLLLGTRLDMTQQRFARSIKRSAESLLGIISDVLDYARIEAGEIDLESIPFDLRMEIEELLLLLAPQAHEKGLEVLCDIPRGLPTAVRGDPLRLRQILTNLVGNAIKFTEQGEIMVAVELAEDAPESLYLFRVEDTGIGLTEAQRETVFETFRQAEGSTARRYGGTGLGLTIARRLVEGMRGSISVASTPGQGSVFSFTARLAPETSAVEGGVQEPQVRFSGRRALIVDDHARAGALLSHQCRDLGLDVEHIAVGSKAAETLQSASIDGHPFDVVLIDQKMPGLDGIMLARLLAAVPDIGDCKLILLVGAGPDELEIGRSEPLLNAIVTKPVRPSELARTLARALGGPTPRTAMATRDDRGRFSGRVLLADDVLINQEVASLILQSLGCDVEVAGNGVEVLEALQQERFDLVLMDAMMPEMDGLEATRRLRALEQERGGGEHLPVIALTADVREASRTACLRSGMDDYLRKPLEVRELQSALEHWLEPARPRQVGAVTAEDERSHGQAAPPPGVAGAGTTTSPVTAAADLLVDPGVIDTQILDLIRAMQRPEHPDLVARVLGIYLGEAPRLLEQIQDAVVNGDLEQLGRAAHALKSSSAHIGANSVAALARELELKARKHSKPGVDELLTLIEQSFNDVREALELIAPNRAA